MFGSSNPKKQGGANSLQMHLTGSGLLRLIRHTSLCPEVIASTDVLICYEKVVSMRGVGNRVRPQLPGINFREFVQLLGIICATTMTTNCAHASNVDTAAIVDTFMEQFVLAWEILRGDKSYTTQAAISPDKPKAASQTSTSACRSLETPEKTVEHPPLPVQSASSQQSNNSPNLSFVFRNARGAPKSTVDASHARAQDSRREVKVGAKEDNVVRGSSRVKVKPQMAGRAQLSTANGNRSEKPSRQAAKFERFLVRSALLESKRQQNVERLRSKVQKGWFKSKKVTRSEAEASGKRLAKSRKEYFEKHKEKHEKLATSDSKTGQPFFSPIVNKREPKTKECLYANALKKRQRHHLNAYAKTMEIRKLQEASKMNAQSEEYAAKVLKEQLFSFLTIDTTGDLLSKDQFSRQLKALGADSKLRNVLEHIVYEKVNKYVSLDEVETLAVEAIKSSSLGMEIDNAKLSTKRSLAVWKLGRAFRRYHTITGCHGRRKVTTEPPRFPFKPEISEKSRKLDAKKHGAALTFDERIDVLSKPVLKPDNLETKEEELEECTFKPKISASKVTHAERDVVRRLSQTKSMESETKDDSSESTQETPETRPNSKSAQERLKDFHKLEPKYPKSYLETIRRIREAKKAADMLVQDKPLPRAKRNPQTGHVKVVPFRFSRSQDKIKAAPRTHCSSNEVDFRRPEGDSALILDNLLFVCKVQIAEKPVPVTKRIAVYKNDVPSRLAARFAALYDLNGKAEDQLCCQLKDLIHEYYSLEDSRVEVSVSRDTRHAIC